MKSVAPDDASGMKQQRKSASRGALKGSHTRRRKKGQEEVREPGVREDQSIIS